MTQQNKNRAAFEAHIRNNHPHLVNPPNPVETTHKDWLFRAWQSAIEHERKQRGEPVATVRSVSRNGVKINWLGGFPQIGDRLYLAPQPAETRNDGFDKWLENPYTKTLEKSIKEDYAPQPIAPHSDLVERLRAADKPLLSQQVPFTSIRSLLREAAQVLSQPAAPAQEPSVQRYTPDIGLAGQAYLDKFKYAHPLPTQFRWADLWMEMCKAAAPKFGEEE